MVYTNLDDLSRFLPLFHRINMGGPDLTIVRCRKVLPSLFLLQCKTDEPEAPLFEEILEELAVA